MEKAIKSIVNQLKDNGIFVASIRDYDSLLMDKPPYSPPYINKTDKGQRVSFQTWEWKFPEETGFCQPIVVAQKRVIIEVGDRG